MLLKLSGLVAQAQGVIQAGVMYFLYKKTGQGTRPVMLDNNISRFLSDFFGKAILIAFTILCEM